MANASYLRVTKSETRNLADREVRANRLGHVEPWTASNSAFFAGFVVVVALLALLALALR